jgi:hypothetical protein
MVGWCAKLYVGAGLGVWLLVLYIASAYAGVFDSDDDIVWILNLGNWSILKGYFVDALKHE